MTDQKLIKEGFWLPPRQGGRSIAGDIIDSMLAKPAQPKTAATAAK